MRSIGLCTIVFGPLIGKAADKCGNLNVLMFGSARSILMVLTAGGRTEHFPEVGYVVLAATQLAVGLVWKVTSQILTRAWIRPCRRGPRAA